MASVILSVSAVLAAALLVEWLFVIYTTAARRHVASTNLDKWSAKMGALTIHAMLDFAAIIVFIIVALTLFFIFLERTAGQRVLLSTYRNVTVYIPPEIQKAMDHTEAETRQKIIQSGATGALATIEAEEQEKLAQKPPKKK